MNRNAHPTSSTIRFSYAGWRQKRLSEGNFIKIMASEVFQDRETASEASMYAFLLGLDEGIDPDTVTSFERIEEAVKIGFELCDAAKEEFEALRIPIENVNAFSDPAIKKRAQKHYAKKMMEFAHKFEELGGEVDLTMISLYSLNSQYSSPSAAIAHEIVERHMTNFRVLMYQEALRRINLIGRSETVEEEPENYDRLTLTERKRKISKKLLRIYQIKFGRPSAKRVPWSKINVSGWPAGISTNLSRLVFSEIAAIKRNLDQNMIVFDYLQSPNQ